MHRPAAFRAVSLLATVVLTACTATSDPAGTPVTQDEASPTPAATAAATPDATASVPAPGTPGSCPLPPSGLETLIEHQEDPLPCWGSAELTVVAQVGGLWACDGYEMDPAWFGCEGLIELLPPPDEASRAPIVLAVRGGPSLFASLHPESGLQRDAVAGRVVVATGHYDDPAAMSCRIVGGGFGDMPPPPPHEVVDGCRRTFVVTAMELWQP